MRFGLFSLIPRVDVGRSPAEVFAETYELAQLADECEPFDSAWVAEHHFSNYGLVASPLPFILDLAHRTRRLRLASGVLVLPFYNPVRAAEEIALVDQLSGGRLIVGVGRGYQPYEFARYGADIEDSRPRFDETLEIILAALSGRTFRHSGAHFQIPPTSLALPPLQQPHPPFVLAATTPETLGQAARRGFGVVNTASWQPVETIGEVRRAYDEQLELAGRPAAEADFSCMRFVFVTDSRAEMLRAAEAALWIVRVSAGFRTGATRVTDGQATVEPLEGEPSPEVFAERMIFGDVETCQEKLEHLRAVTRSTRLICNVQLGGLPHPLVRRSLERFAERIAPRLAEVATAGA